MEKKNNLSIDDIISLMNEDDFFDILTEFLESAPRNRDIAVELMDIVDCGWDLESVYDTLFMDFKKFLKIEEIEKLTHDYRCKFDD